MPFGTEIQSPGCVRFRLWAPAAERVDIHWQSQGRAAEIAMNAVGDGWFETVTAMIGEDVDYGFRIDACERLLPDPASRFQAHDVHGLSRLVDPAAWNWRDETWNGRAWEEAVIYELHVGTFTPSGDFSGVRGKLDHLVELGITALELMPIADFPGRFNWGYDGVLPFAPDSRYGSPADLKLLVQTAHEKGLMVFLDVVWNHFGPEGNYLHRYAPQFFSTRHQTPWGDAINFDNEGSAVVRQFFIHNALYWLEEFHMDGLRFDAIHAVFDDSEPSIWEELAQAVYQGPGADRQIHLTLENDNNGAYLLHRYAQGEAYRAQWNDDFHHALHVQLTGESRGYFVDYSQSTLQYLGRTLTSGFAYQGEVSTFRDGKPRGEPSGELPPTAFVAFMQNHDQIGNRPGGERIAGLVSASALSAATALLVLAPAPPLFFMGQEWGSIQPFCYFCDFEPELSAKVTRGRRRESSRTMGLSNCSPVDVDWVVAFERCRLDWNALAAAKYRRWLHLHRALLKIRHVEIVPRLPGMTGGRARFECFGNSAIRAEWRMGDDSRLTVLANLSEVPLARGFELPGRPIYTSHPDFTNRARQIGLPPWSVGWFIQPALMPR